MKTKILSGLICCLGIFSANAQTITAPVGQPLTITNAVDVTGGGLNIMSNNEFKIGGQRALATPGTYNVFIGQNTGVSISTGSYNMFLGGDAGQSTTTGVSNAFLGAFAGNANTTGESNMFFGTNSGRSNTTGSFNAYIGTVAGYGNTTGSNNVGIGWGAGSTNITGSKNTYIGYYSQGAAGLTNATAIGADANVTASNTIVLGNAATTITGTGLAGSSGLRFANLNSSSGTTSVPGGKVLSVDGAGNVVLVQISGATTSSTGTTAPVADATWKNQDGYLYNNSTNGVVINGSGLEGNALIVKGGVLSKEVNVKVEGSESWPDYVFKPSYKRMSLDEVEKFININGHLPNVPSATEMVANGNNLGKTDVKLLEKVEELTLYLLEMKKANEVQNAEIQNLKKQVKSLRKK